MKKLRETDVLSHDPSQPSLVDSAQDRISEDQDMKDAIIIRNTLAVTKLLCNFPCGVVRVIGKPDQKNIDVFENVVDHVCDAPPFHYLLDI